MNEIFNIKCTFCGGDKLHVLDNSLSDPDLFCKNCNLKLYYEQKSISLFSKNKKYVLRDWDEGTICSKHNSFIRKTSKYNEPDYCSECRDLEKLKRLQALLKSKKLSLKDIELIHENYSNLMGMLGEK